MNEKEELPVATPTHNEVQISKEDFSKLSYRQKFAVSEYGYLLSVEDAETVGKMLGNITQEKNILAFCQAKGKRVLNFDESMTTADTVRDWPSIGLIGFLAGIIPGLIMFIFLSAIGIPSLGICSGLGVVMCGLIGAEIGKRSKKTVWIAAVLLAILGAVLLFALLASVCAFCQ